MTTNSASSSANEPLPAVAGDVKLSAIPRSIQLAAAARVPSSDSSVKAEAQLIIELMTWTVPQTTALYTGLNLHGGEFDKVAQDVGRPIEQIMNKIRAEVRSGRLSRRILPEGELFFTQNKAGKPRRPKKKSVDDHATLAMKEAKAAAKTAAKEAAKLAREAAKEAKKAQAAKVVNRKWTNESLDKLFNAVSRFGSDWAYVATEVGNGKDMATCEKKFNESKKSGKFDKWLSGSSTSSATSSGKKRSSRKKQTTKSAADKKSIISNKASKKHKQSDLAVETFASKKQKVTDKATTPMEAAAALMLAAMSPTNTKATTERLMHVRVVDNEQ